ncbi:MAG: ABC transporter ATP-binding protein [Patescibacteria group bacterium]|jgi:putative ABC transport system ATP-binding protein
MEFIQGFNISKSFNLGKRKIRVLNSNNFAIKEGDFAVILGESGCGKTTLLNILAGLDKITSGELHIMGDDINAIPRKKINSWRADHLGIVFQHFNLIPFMSATENVALPLIFRGISKKTRLSKAKSLLKSVGLSDRVNHVPSELSGGEQQRVAIARALVTSPKIIIADEPTGELDSKNSADVMEFFARINKDLKTTIIMATHNPSYAFHASRIIHLFDGHITSQQVKKN